MAVGMSMQVTGMKQALKAIKATQGALSKDYRKLWDRVIITLEQIFDRRFKSSNKGRWEPLKPLTIQLSRPHNPLLLSGTGRGSLGGRNSFSVRDIKRGQLKFGTKYKPLGIQDAGFTQKVTGPMRGFFISKGIPWIPVGGTLKVPKRKIMFLEPEDEKRIHLAWRSWGNKQIDLTVKRT